MIVFHGEYRTQLHALCPVKQADALPASTEELWQNLVILRVSGAVKLMYFFETGYLENLF
jgi:hypothetical protein